MELLDFFLGVRERAKPLMRIIFHSWVLGAWSLSYLWAKSEMVTRKERERREGALIAAERAELQMLRFQLNPHFLFNSLNNVVTEVQKRPDVALEMIHRLAEYMRHSLEYKGEMLVPLTHEIEGAREYLEIEKQRFGDRLDVGFESENIDAKHMVPSFLLQPLVENAVKHGMNSCPPPWEVLLKVKAIDERIEIRLSSSGKLETNTGAKGGVGLDILSRRLALHYPERGEFDLRQEGRYVMAELILKGEPC
ncbi:MAG: sensor histidine kinase [Maribacter stanieri]